MARDEAELGAAKKKAEKLLGAIAQIQSKIENAGGKKLKDQKAKGMFSVDEFVLFLSISICYFSQFFL